MRWRFDRHTAVACAAILASAAAVFLGTGLQPVWWMTWIAPLPVVAWALGTGGGAAFAGATVAWALGSLNEWHYLRDLIRLPAVVMALAMLAPALVFAAGVVLTRSLAIRGSRLAVLGLPVAVTFFEQFMAATSPDGTFGSLAYTQAACLPVLQVASITGYSGITFLVLLVPTAAALALRARGAQAGRAAAVGASVVLATALAYGATRLLTHDASPAVTIGLVASDANQPADLSTDAGRRLLERYVSHGRALAEAGARVLVFPETAFKSSSSRADLQPLADLATGAHATVVVGLDRVLPPPEQNTAVLFAPSGTRTDYAKQRLLASFEARYAAGDRPVVVQSGAAALGLAVCKDLDFPGVIREYASKRPSLLIVPAWDFTVDGWLHSRMAIVRGVELAIPIARSAREGRLTLSDSRGRVVAESATSASAISTVLGTLPPGDPTTLYARSGDWFQWVVAAMLGACLRVLVRRHRSTSRAAVVG